MKIFVKVKAGSAQNRLERIDARHYEISAIAPPARGQANTAVIEILAEHLNIPKSLLVIRRGKHAKQKTIEILTNQNLR